ncbi:MAG: hypothetical protein HNEKOMLI_00429 [Sodalis sp. Psp]|nr:hypothetical protein [Sodalis sp. Psp]MCR3756906.1 hypothetical protein [Sodalis sp. Ppy]
MCKTDGKTKKTILYIPLFIRSVIIQQCYSNLICWIGRLEYAAFVLNKQPQKEQRAVF